MCGVGVRTFRPVDRPVAACRHAVSLLSAEFLTISVFCRTSRWLRALSHRHAVLYRAHSDLTTHTRLQRAVTPLQSFTQTHPTCAFDAGDPDDTNSTRRGGYCQHVASFKSSSESAHFFNTWSKKTVLYWTVQWHKTDTEWKLLAYKN